MGPPVCSLGITYSSARLAGDRRRCSLAKFDVKSTSRKNSADKNCCGLSSAVLVRGTAGEFTAGDGGFLFGWSQS